MTGLWAIANIADNAGNKQLLRPHLDLIESTMQRYPSNEDILKHGKRAVKNINVKNIKVKFALF